MNSLIFNSYFKRTNWKELLGYVHVRYLFYEKLSLIVYKFYNKFFFGFMVWTLNHLLNSL